MPTPFAQPPTRNDSVSAKAIFGTVSVVMIASANALPPAGESASTSSGNAAVIVCTCYARLADAATTTEALTECLSAAYVDAPFVRVLPAGAMVDSKRARGANVVELQAIADPRTGSAIVVGALDNLVKGAAGQAIQNYNLMNGLPETTGLSTAGIVP